jgi:hypothetical protein
MLTSRPLPRLSSLREALDSFEHAYAVATRWHGTGTSPVYVLRTPHPLQPIRVTTGRPRAEDRLIMVLL